MEKGRANLDFIKFVPANNEFHASIPLLQGLHPLSNFSITSAKCPHQDPSSELHTPNAHCLPLLFESPDINSDGEHANVNEMIIHLDTFGQRLQGQNAGHSLTEVTRIVGRLEANEICGEHSTKQVLANRQTAENFRRWKCHMQEKPDDCSGQLFTDKLGHEHQVIIINPDEAACQR